MIIRILFILLAIAALPAHAEQASVPVSQQQIQLSFAPVVKQVSPAVVNIYTKRTVSIKQTHPFFDDPMFAPFFDQNFFGRQMRPRAESALGSGVIVDSSGLVVTNAHVVRGAEEIKVGLADGREFDAKLALADAASDLALLRLESVQDELPHVALKPSEALAVGDLVLAIGNPFGVGQTVTSGIVSALARSTLNISDFNFFIQTDAAINPGNSGGPLVALDGGVVGINTAIFSQTGGSLGIGFAIPSEMVVSVIAAEKAGQTGERGVLRPWLGVTAQTVTPDIASSLNLSHPRGALIAALHSSSPLRKAGIEVGDVVLSLNGHDIGDASEMKFRMATVPLGEKAQVKISRQGKNESFQVEAIAAPEIPPREETALTGSHPLNGAVIANMSPAVAVDLGIHDDEKGVVVIKTERGAPAARIVSAGDILLTINNRTIHKPSDVENALKFMTKEGWSFTIQRGGRVRQIIIR